MRPASLAEVARLAAGGDSFDRCLANFLDHFYSRPSPESLAEEPLRLAELFGEPGRVRDAYLAAVAEELSRAYGFEAPDWTPNPSRALRYPWFASNLASLRAILLVESPPGFRCRNLFVSENALSRA